LKRSLEPLDQVVLSRVFGQYKKILPGSSFQRKLKITPYLTDTDYKKLEKKMQ
jgi:hypothetical protein